MIYFYAALSMCLKDACGTMLVVAEARGRPWTAGAMDSLGDLAQVLVVLFGAGQILEHGWDTRSLGVLAVIMLTSLAGTALWTRVAATLMPQESPMLAELRARIEQLEDALRASASPTTLARPLPGGSA